jgi:hypothetical protein
MEERVAMYRRLAEATGNSLGAVYGLREEEWNSLIEALGLGRPLVGLVNRRTGGAQLVCPQCGDPCSSPADRRMHMRVAHIEAERDPV